MHRIENSQQKSSKKLTTELYGPVIVHLMSRELPNLLEIRPGDFHVSRTVTHRKSSKFADV